ncbi:MAG: S-methyl-5'-thioadenosine phosphorylase [Anaerolineae bacterium]|nr:S-methyl-5'-thioadenosine phosphorylase [Anaerolineae bacterium]
MPDAELGIIGGSGLYDIEGLGSVTEVSVDTPFGPPSDTIILGRLGPASVAFLPRHGRGHRISPTELNSRANIWALKSLGVTHVVSVSACGSLREELRPRDVVVPHQLIDFTRLRQPNTFFSHGIVAHIGFADPFCPHLSRVLAEVIRQVRGATVHEGATFITIEGPRFSTKAESHAFRSWGADIIGMTASPEAQLAREAGLCYACMAHVTDYDVWHETEEPVTVEAIVANLQANIGIARQAIRLLADRFPLECESTCRDALKNAIMTDLDLVPPETQERLSLILGQHQ